MASFQDLTVELVDLIAAELDDASLGAFRLTSRECRERSHKQFASRVCDPKYLIAEGGLKSLLSLSENKTLGSALRTLRLSSAFHNEHMAKDSYKAQFQYTKNPVERETISQCKKLFEERLRQQKALTFPKAVEIVQKILAESPNLTAVEVGQWGCEDPGRRAQGNDGLGRLPHPRKPFCLPNSRVQTKSHGRVPGLAYSFAVALRALAANDKETTGKEITSLSAHCWDGKNNGLFHQIPLRVLSSMIPMDTLGPGLAKALRNLRCLCLSVMFYRDKQYDKKPRLSHGWLAHFLGLCWSLEHFRLICDGWPDPHPFRDSPSVASGFTTFIDFLPSLALHHLKHLELVHVELRDDQLRKFIEKMSGTLTNLTLHLVKLSTCSWKDFLPALQENASKESCYNLEL